MRLVVAVPDQVEPDPDSAELRKQSHATRIYERLMRDVGTYSVQTVYNVPLTLEDR